MQRPTQQSRVMAITILVVICCVLRRAATIVLSGCLQGTPVGNHRPGRRGVTVHNCSLPPQLEVGELIDDQNLIAWGRSYGRNWNMRLHKACAFDSLVLTDMSEIGIFSSTTSRRDNADIESVDKTRGVGRRLCFIQPTPLTETAGGQEAGTGETDLSP
jgi:hypothetical protein